MSGFLVVAKITEYCVLVVLQKQNIVKCFCRLEAFGRIGRSQIRLWQEFHIKIRSCYGVSPRKILAIVCSIYSVTRVGTIHNMDCDEIVSLHSKPYALLTVPASQELL